MTGICQPNTNLKGLKASMTYTTLTYWHILVCRDEKKNGHQSHEHYDTFPEIKSEHFNHQSGLKYPF